MAAESYPSLAGGQRITGSLLRSMIPQVVRKTADTNRSAVTSRTADPHLAFDGLANAVYVFDGWLKFDGDVSGDISLQLTVPSGALGDMTSWGAGNNVIGATAVPALQSNVGDPRGYMVRTESLDVNSARTYGTLGVGGTPMGMTFYGTVRMSSTPGTISIDWAQAVSSATATSTYTDSWLRFQRLA
jgi:hypothetical protein